MPVFQITYVSSGFLLKEVDVNAKPVVLFTNIIWDLS